MFPKRRLFRQVMMISLFIFCGLIVKSGWTQYFGQNKMQYEDFKFRILKSEHFDIYYYPTEERAAKIVAKMAERWYARYSKFFGFGLSSRQPLILYASNPQFQETNTVFGEIGEGVGGDDGLPN